MNRTRIISSCMVLALFALSGLGQAQSQAAANADMGMQTVTSTFYAAGAQKIEVIRQLSADKRLNESVCRSGPMVARNCLETNRVLETAEFNCVRQVLNVSAPNYPSTALYNITPTESLREFSALSCMDKPKA